MGSRGRTKTIKKNDVTNNVALGQGALLLAGASWETDIPPLHSSLRSYLPAPTSGTKILISTADGEGNGSAGGGGNGWERRGEEED